MSKLVKSIDICGGRNGCKNPASEPHSCPYQNDVNNNDDPEYCTCCEDCTQECNNDI